MRTTASNAILFLATVSCATTTTTSTTWVAPAAGANWVRSGRVESVQEIVQRVEGNPGGGALAGALIYSLFRPGETVVLTPAGLARS